MAAAAVAAAEGAAATARHRHLPWPAAQLVRSGVHGGTRMWSCNYGRDGGKGGGGGGG